MLNNARSWAAITALVLLVAMAGCSSPPLRVGDNSASTANLRVVTRFSGPGGGGIEFDAFQVSGKANQVINPDATYQLGDQLLSGPGVWAHSARARHVHVVYNHALFADRPFQLEWFAGASLASLKWQVRTGDPLLPFYEHSKDWVGPMGGVHLRWKLTAALALEGRAWGAVSAKSGSGGYQGGGELMLAYQPVPLLRLRFGLMQSQTKLATSEEQVGGRLRSTPAFSLATRGPALGATFSF